MKKFTCRVHRTLVQWIEIDVEAEDEEKAAEQAVKEAYNVNLGGWNGNWDESEYEVDDVEEINESEES